MSDKGLNAAFDVPSGIRRLARRLPDHRTFDSRWYRLEKLIAEKFPFLCLNSFRQEWPFYRISGGQFSSPDAKFWDKLLTKPSFGPRLQQIMTTIFANLTLAIGSENNSAFPRDFCTLIKQDLNLS